MSGPVVVDPAITQAAAKHSDWVRFTLLLLDHPISAFALRGRIGTQRAPPHGCRTLRWQDKVSLRRAARNGRDAVFRRQGA